MSKVISKFKRNIVIILMTVVLSATVLITVTYPETDTLSIPAIASIQTDEKPIIVIDAGHGGLDGGASGYDGVPEKIYNLSLAKKLKFFFDCAGFETVMTRKDDGDTDNKDGFYKKSDLTTRINLANKNPNSIFISIHLNISTSPKDNGLQLFYGTVNEKSKELAIAVKNIIEQKNVCRRVREVTKSPGTVYIQKNVTCPSLLVECGFMSNSEDYTLIKDSNYQEKLMFVLFTAVCSY